MINATFDKNCFLIDILILYNNMYILKYLKYLKYSNQTL